MIGDLSSVSDTNDEKDEELPVNLLIQLFGAENLDNTKEPPALHKKLVILGVLLEALKSTLEVPNLQ
ncbi:3690_t:CDS:2 [Funneliformis geosporum]|uniref:3690_t:CDS:1 n=1 Tax=Funneliformis geosporum TaxID=1117311 RepID=A0A9W4WQ33_9GLOM|nr:3690_t:CDS:2 [Funneliformis geosporum]